MEAAVTGKSKAMSALGKFKSSFARFFTGSSVGVSVVSAVSAGTAFQALPADIIINVFFEIECLKDLHSFVQTSPFIYQLFLHHKPALLEKPARIMLGDAWGEGTEVLIWQRHTTAKKTAYHLVLRDLSRPFVLRDSDLRRLIENCRWFERCRDIHRDLVRESRDQTRPAYCPRHVRPCFLGDGGSDGDGDSDLDRFPRRLFYASWLLQLRFHHERIEYFAARARPAPQEVGDCILMASTMLYSGASGTPGLGFEYLPAGGDAWQRLTRKNFGEMWSWSRPPPRVNVELFVMCKLLCHLVTRAAREVRRWPWGEVEIAWAEATIVELEVDYAIRGLGLEEIMLKYRIPGGD